eukprot:6182183-Pleurochrysis_carterae.AAC.2
MDAAAAAALVPCAQLRARHCADTLGAPCCCTDSGSPVSILLLKQSSRYAVSEIEEHFFWVFSD